MVSLTLIFAVMGMYVCIVYVSSTSWCKRWVLEASVTTVNRRKL